jgi:hypothetical protein
MATTKSGVEGKRKWIISQVDSSSINPFGTLINPLSKVFKMKPMDGSFSIAPVEKLIERKQQKSPRTVCTAREQ